MENEQGERRKKPFKIQKNNKRRTLYVDAVWRLAPHLEAPFDALKKVAERRGEFHSVRIYFLLFIR